MYRKFQGELLEAKLEQYHEVKLKEAVAKELADFQRQSEHERKVRLARTHIVECILTLRCPNPNGCRQAFVDFSGCFALQCSRCKSHFCGWCLAHCGSSREAHVHVRSCDQKLSDDAYYGSEAEFVRSNERRYRDQLQQYLLSVDRGLVDDVLASVLTDLMDLGLHDVIQQYL